MNDLKKSVKNVPDKKIKQDSFEKLSLTEKQLKCGSLRGKVRYYSERLRCYFFLKPGVSFEETEQKYIEANMMLSKSAKMG